LLYAFSGEGYSYAELKQAVDSTRQQLLRVKDVEKVDLIGVQDEKIYVEFSDKKLAELGLDASVVAEPLQAQNGMTPAGTVISAQRNLPLRLTGSFDSVESMPNLARRRFCQGHSGLHRPVRIQDALQRQRSYRHWRHDEQNGRRAGIRKDAGSDHEPNRGETSCRHGSSTGR